MERYFNSLGEQLGDGVVSLASAKLKGVSDFVLLEGNHISILANLVGGGENPPAIAVVMDRLGYFPKSSKSQIKSDEEVIFFDTFGHFDLETQTWTIPVHGWIFEYEKGSLLRKSTLSLFSKALGLSGSKKENELFKKRAAYFIADNEGDKEVQVSLRGKAYTMKPSGADGHFFTDLKWAGDIKSAEKFLHFQAITKLEDTRSFSGWVGLVGPEGLSVISDIDDTIKVSSVLHKKTLLKNTFLKDFEAVKGMSELYQKWMKQGASFNYVSSSPWQLYPELHQFILDEGFPRGEMNLRAFRFKDKSVLNLFKSSLESKISAIQKIIEAYPKRKFILVGDSGEKDPEVYGHVARIFPSSIKHI